MSASGLVVAETTRLRLRRLTLDDAEFVLALVNEPSWLRFIGDKGVRTLDDARTYLISGPLDMYQRRGFGLYMTELKADGCAIGICGLIKRPALEDVDIGFAFLPAYWRRGYAFEAASAVIQHGRDDLGLHRLAAITAPDNDASGRLLEKLGFRFERLTRLSTDTGDVKLFVLPEVRPGGLGPEAWGLGPEPGAS